jgi:hypothetical protein
MEPFITIWVAIALVFGGVWGTIILRALVTRKTKDLEPGEVDDQRLLEMADDTQLLTSRIEQLEEEVSFLRELRQPPADPQLPPSEDA